MVQSAGVCGGAVHRGAAGDTAFAHRDSAFFAPYLAHWSAPATDAEVDRHEGRLDGLRQDLRPWHGGANQNYTDPKLTGRRVACYRPNPARLQKVRRSYDPDRLFRFPHAV